MCLVLRAESSNTLMTVKDAYTPFHVSLATLNFNSNQMGMVFS